MCTGIEIAGLALTAAGTAASMSAANANAEAQAQAAAQQYEAAAKENYRLMGENNRIAAEQQSDRIRQANKELGVLRANADLGIAGSSMTGLMVQTAYNEGLDLSRIETNRYNQQKALEASTEAGRIGALSTINAASNQAQSAKIGSAMKFVSSGLSLYGDYQYRQTLNKTQQGKTE